MLISEQLWAALSLATNTNLIYLSHLYKFVIWKWLKYTKNWTGSPLLHLLPSGDLAVCKMATLCNDIPWYGGYKGKT